MATFDTEMKSLRLLHHQTAQMDADAQAYDPKVVTVTTIQQDRVVLHQLIDDLKGHRTGLSAVCNTDKELKDAGSLLTTVMSFIRKALSKLSSLEHTINPSGTAGPSTVSTVRLPKLDLPSFDGKQDEWMSFRDRFTSSITKNAGLSGSQKLDYLQGVLRGEAARVISNLELIDGNFAIAWQLLIDRYDNLREIVFAILRSFFSLPKLNVENATSLRKLVDVSLQCHRSLKVLKRPVDHWDDVLVYIIVDKMDSTTKREWAKTLRGTAVPTYKEVTDFLDNHIRGLNVSGGSKQPQPQSSATKGSHHSSSSTTVKCSCCEQEHALYACSKFKALSPQGRVAHIKSNGLCFNCLSCSHMSSDCTSKGRCKTCKGKHNSLLHLPKEKEKKPQPATHNQGSDGDHADEDSSDPHQSTSTNCVSSHISNHHGILLGTAEVEVLDSCGDYRKCRVFLDPGSETSLITDKYSKMLGLRKQNCNVGITGVSEATVGRASGSVHCTIRSRIRDFDLGVNCLILSKVTGNLPSFSSTQEHTWAHLNGLQLADPQFLQPREVDILLGADVTGTIFLDGRRMGRRSEPIARNSEFGWVITGPTGAIASFHATANNLFMSVKAQHISVSSDDMIKRFWEIEEVANHPNFTREEQICEDHFAKHHYRTAEGRYVVPVAYNERLNQLGTSYEMARKRLLQLEKRFNKNPTYRTQYNEFLKEYLDLGHMEPVPGDECGETVGRTNYLPHHFVIKEDSTTTKLRVVFDGSAKTSTGISYNDCLLVGPTVQEGIFQLLLRFRTYPVALKADATKMYRQFLLPIKDQDRQRILWRASLEEPIKEFRLKTVTYGTACAPHSATRSLQQLIQDEGESFPMTLQMAIQSFYVDDLMGGAADTDAASQIIRELTHIMSKGGLELRKWDSNDPNVLQFINPKLVEHNSAIDSHSHITKALGVQWNSVDDVMLFSGYQPKPITSITKRTMLSEMSRIFDPLGWLGPVIVGIKIFFQELWLPIMTASGEQTLSWDDQVPLEFQHKWTYFIEDVTAIQSIRIPRLSILPNNVALEIHGFSDASESAYAAAVYMRNFQANGSIEVRLLTAKSKVAPLKFLSVPRLELCGALLLARLITEVVTALNITAPIFAWTDSEITLRWVSTSSKKWKTFVANRVAEIHESLPSESWKFIPGYINPADLATRGIRAAELTTCKLWWNGPQELSTPGIPTYQNVPNVSEEDLEVRNKVVMSANITHDDNILTKYSSLLRLKRVTAYVLRFSFNCRNKANKNSAQQTGPLTLDEMNEALTVLTRLAQLEFSDDITQLQLGKKIKSTSRLLPLNPFLDKRGVLRVGGRLHRSSLNMGNKHQIILPPTSQLTILIIRMYHITHHHAGFTLLYSNLCREYWILRGRNAAKGIIRKCVTCRRVKATTASQLMGSLPRDRVTPNNPFQKSGVDYAGPFMLQTTSGRGKKQFKAYFCLFVCFSVKAVHLEVVTDLTTEAFIAALKRFTARRGLPTDLYSDCGTNFVGADKELQALVRSDRHNHDLVEFLAGEGIKWHFLPASSPHQGGLWESAVRSVKYHLRRIIGSTVLTLEEFSTILCQVEGVLNSRPISAMSQDPEDYDVLTPAHFLIGRPITAVPEHDLTTLKVNRLSRWERCQQFQQHLWSRWYKEYLNFLQERGKWRKEFPNVSVGDLVLLKDDNLGPLQWKRARVTAVHSGPDGLVRVVSVKTKTGETKRSVVKISPLLPVDEQ